MKTRNLHLVPILFMLLLTLNSCEEIIDFRGDRTEPGLVLYTLLNPDSLITVTLSRSHAIFETNYQPSLITGATVVVFIDDIPADTLGYVPQIPEEENPGQEFYSKYASSTLKPVSGPVYRFEASAPGLPPVSVSTTLPTAVPLERIDTLWKRIEVPAGYYDDIYFRPWYIEARAKFTDPGGERNYYRMTVTYFTGYYSGPRDLPYDPEYPVRLSYGDCSYIAREDPVISPPGSGDDPFTNTTGNSYYIFTDDFFEGRSYELTLKMSMFNIDTLNHEFCHFNVSLHSISESLYKYLWSLSAQQQTGDMPFSEPVLVYSNVKGGLGIAASQSISSTSVLTGRYPVEGVIYE
ncbi:MAG: DUF4249 domain-containing protein [Bacteroidales bacterium]|nr:DUF4249 domain-containing protein [Bacteroidales bacterium]